MKYRVVESVGAGYAYVKQFRVDVRVTESKEPKLLHRLPLGSFKVRGVYAS